MSGLRLWVKVDKSSDVRWVKFGGLTPRPVIKPCEDDRVKLMGESLG